MRKTIMALAVANLVMLPMMIATCRPDTTESPRIPVALDEAEPHVSQLGATLGAALDYVAELPESRDPVHFGSRTFEVSGEVLVKVDADIADAETVIEERGWALVVQSPRICGETWDLADSGGYPYCWLRDDPDALYLRVSSAQSLGAAGYEVVVHPYRNVRLPTNHDLSQGLGFEDHDFDGHKAELAWLISGISDHPGILSDGGLLRIRVGLDGMVSHEGDFSGWFYSNPNGEDDHPRGIQRVGHIGPINPPVTEADRRVDAAFDACERFEWDSEDHRKCRNEAYEIWRAAWVEERERSRVAVETARAIVGEVAK